MIESEFKWLWSTEFKDARRGAYKVLTSSDGSNPEGGVRIGDKQYLIPVSSTSSSSSNGSSSSVPQHFLEFIRTVPAAWLLSAATDANLVSLFPVKDLPPYDEKKKKNKDKPGGGDFKGLQEPMWAWSIQCEESGLAGITRGIFHPQHALRLCWDTYAIYAMACMQSGDEINVVRILKSKLPQRYESSTVDWQVAFRRLQVGCRLWHALLARRTHMTVDRLSSTANDVRKAVQAKLIQQSTITTSIINGTAVPGAKKKKKKDSDDEEEQQQQQTTTLETILSDFVSQQATTGRALAAINDALLSKQSSLMLNVEFWKEFVLNYCPEIQQHGQTKSEKNARVVQFARSLASLPSTDKEAMEVEWKEGALELQDWSLISSSSAAVIIPSQAISSEETPRSHAFKTVEDAVRYVRRRGFLLCAYPIVLSLGYLFPGEHIKYINRLEQPATYAYMMKRTASSTPLLLQVNGKGKQRQRAQAMMDETATAAASIQATVDGMQSLIDKRLRLGSLFKTYKARRGMAQPDRLPPLDYDQLAKEVTDMKFLPESKLPFYVGILETLKTQQASLGKRGSESLVKLIDALDSRVGPALLISEYTKSLRQQIAEGGNITSVRLQRGIAALMMRKGIGETQAVRMILDSTVNHVIGHPEVVQTIMDDNASLADSGDLFRQLQQAIEERSSGSSRMMMVDDTPLASSSEEQKSSVAIEVRQKKRTEQQAMDLSSSSDGKETKKQSVSRKPTAPSNDPFLGEEEGEETATSVAAADDGLDGLIMLSNAISASTPLPPSSDETAVGQIGKKNNKKKRIRESDDESGECASPTKRARV
jgi:hypothetical protein